MINEFTNLITKISFKDFLDHLRQYTELYLYPFKSWKKAYSQRKTGFDFTVLNIIYYTLIVFILSENFHFSVKVVSYEVLLTLIPFAIFFIPFEISKMLFHIHKKWTKAFRVFLIIKFQLIPPLLIIWLFIKNYEIESLYILVENYIWIIWLGFIIIVPIINNISVFRKIFWIFLNYIFFLLSFFFIALILNRIDQNDSFISKISLNTPNIEYQKIKLRSFFSLDRVNENGYIVELKIIEDQSFIIENTQFATPQLARIIIKNSMNEIYNRQIEIDSILKIQDSTYISDISKYRKVSVMDLNKEVLDSIRNINNNYFFSDLKLYQNASKSSYFESNKKYFRLYYENLKHYDSLFINPKIVKNIVEELKPISIVHLDNDRLLVYYELSDEFLFSKKNELIIREEELKKREIKSNYLFNILFYPLDRFFYYFNEG